MWGVSISGCGLLNITTENPLAINDRSRGWRGTSGKYPRNDLYI